MRLIYITGSSSGLGKALTEEYLRSKENKVIGISRKNQMEHPNYSHIRLDLSNLKEYASFAFQSFQDYSEVVFINNAGTVSPVAPTGQYHIKEVEESYHLNLLAPIFFINQLVFISKSVKIPIYVLNISSGAAEYPIEGWSVYCSTKAALNTFTSVVHEETKNTNFFIKCVAPGIVDTPMQEQIRSKSEEEFKEVARFKEYKKQGELLPPEEVAKKIIRNFKSLYSSTKVVASIRDY